LLVSFPPFLSPCCLPSDPLVFFPSINDSSTLFSCPHQASPHVLSLFTFLFFGEVSEMLLCPFIENSPLLTGVNHRGSSASGSRTKLLCVSFLFSFYVEWFFTTQPYHFNCSRVLLGWSFFLLVFFCLWCPPPFW